MSNCPALGTYLELVLLDHIVAELIMLVLSDDSPALTASGGSMRLGQAHRFSVPVVLGLLLAVSALVVGGRICYVHRTSYEWAWTPSALAPRIQFHGRDYDRSASTPSTSIHGKVLGHTAGGGLIVGAAINADLVPTVVEVVDGNRQATYALSGGP